MSIIKIYPFIIFYLKTAYGLDRFLHTHLWKEEHVLPN